MISIARCSVGLFMLVVFSSAGALAQGKLQIVSPASGTAIVPGTSLQIVMRQLETLPPIYFDDTIGLSGPLAATQTVESLDPYIFRISIPVGLRPGEYVLGGFGRHSGDSGYESTQKISLVVLAPTIDKINIDNGPFVLRFPGDSSRVNITAFAADKYLGALPEILMARAVFSVDDPSVASVDSGGNLIGLKEGTTTVRVNVDQFLARTELRVDGSQVRGDLNGDRSIDVVDISLMQRGLNKRVQVPGDPRDLNRDGRIDALDLRLLTSLCSKPRCQR